MPDKIKNYRLLLKLLTSVKRNVQKETLTLDKDIAFIGELCYNACNT